MKKSGILVVGSSNTDMIVQLKKLPGPGETVINGKFSTAPGGKITSLFSSRMSPPDNLSSALLTAPAKPKLTGFLIR